MPRSVGLLLAVLTTATLTGLTEGGAAADWEVKRSPFNRQIVDRYLAVLRKNPDDSLVLKRLVALYKRYRTVDEIEREVVTRAAAGHQVADEILAGHLARERGDQVTAAARYRAALVAHPDDQRLSGALAEALIRSGHAAEARPLLETALPRLEGARRRLALRQLADLALDAKDLPAAQRWFDQLLKIAPEDTDARRSFAEALAAQGHHAEALAAWRAIEPRLASQPERRAEAMRRIGELAEATHDDVAALAAYRRGLQLLPRGHFLRRDLTDKVISVYRRKDDLRSLISERESDGGHRGFTEWETLARLYEEVGDTPHATEAFRKALGADPHALEARRRLIGLLEREGRDAEVIAEYRRLVKEAPGEVKFQLELAERLARSGDGGKQARALLAEIGRRFPGDASVHGALAELYGRWGDSEAAQREQELLVKLEPSDEAHIVDLGEIYWQRSKKKLAVDTWNRLLTIGKEKARNMARLAEVLIDHGKTGEAVELYDKALKLMPQDFAIRRGRANAMERASRGPHEAEKLWLDIYVDAKEVKDRPLRLEARQHIIHILHQGGRLATRLVQLKRLFDGPPPVDALGPLLAEGNLKLGRSSEALRILDEVVRRARTPEEKGEALLGVAQVRRSLHHLEEALKALNEAAALLPSRSREIFPQIAELSLELHKDEDALTFAHRAVAIAPNDAQAEVRLAEILEKKEDDAGAIEHYRKALALDPRRFRTHKALAHVYLRRSQPAEAARLYREVVAQAPEEELVLEAASRAIDLEEYLGTLGDLERALTPLVYMHSQKPVYRRMLVDLYVRYATPLARRARAGDAAARKELNRLGQHGLKPLLETLVEADSGRQRAAVTLLGELGNNSAAPLLIKLAAQGPTSTVVRLDREPRSGRWRESQRDVDLRVAALIAASNLDDPRLVPELIRLATDKETKVRVAATHGLGRAKDPKGLAAAALARGLHDPRGEVQMMAALAMSARGGPLDPRAVAHLQLLLGEVRREELVRAACALALGAAREVAALPALAEALNGSQGQLRRAAAWALGAIGDRRALPSLLRAVYTQDQEVRLLAVEAIARLGDGKAPRLPPLPLPALAISVDGLDVRAALGQIRASREKPALVEVSDGEALVAGISAVLAFPRDVQLRALADLDGADDAIALGPIGWRGADAAALAANLEPTLIELSRSSEASVRARAALVLGKIGTRTARDRLAQTLDDARLEVRLATIGALGRACRAGGCDEATGDGPSVVERLRRRLAAPLAIERSAAATGLGALTASPADTTAVARLLDDRDGYVRGDAAAALARLPGGVVALVGRARAEPVAEVRVVIATALGATHDPRARPALADLRRDAIAAVREAAEQAEQQLDRPQ